jgi:hypothetical protein
VFWERIRNRSKTRLEISRARIKPEWKSSQYEPGEWSRGSELESARTHLKQRLNQLEWYGLLCDY